MMSLPPDVVVVFLAKTVRTFAYGFLGIVLPVYLSELGVPPVGIGIAVTLTLAGSAALTWAIRRPAERYGVRTTLILLSTLSAMAAVILLSSARPALVILAAMIGNVAVGTGETGPFLTLEQVVIARAVGSRRRTMLLSVYNLLGYCAAALGAIAVGLAGGYRPLFAIFLAGAAVQAVVYTRLPRAPVTARRAGPLPSAPLIRRLAALFALDSFAGGFVLQSLVAYFLHERYGLSIETLGHVFFGAQILTAASLLLAARVSASIGLLHTMVWSHLMSNAILIAIAFAPTAAAAIGLLLARHLLSQMDVPTRQAYVMAIVEDSEREAAASLTNLARTVAQAITPALSGWVMQAVALSAPFVLGGALKIAYDLLMFAAFRAVPLRAESE
jgi:MFS family permease